MVRTSMTHSAMPCVLVYHFFILTRFVVIYDLLLTHTWVIVKKSSPKNLSADCRPTGFARNIGYLLVLNLSVTCWLALGRLSVTCRPTGFLGSSSSQLPIHGNMESICQIYTTINFMLMFTNNTPFHHYIGKTKTTIISYTCI